MVKYRTAWLKEEEEEQRKSFDDDDDDELCRNERVSPRFGAFEKRRQTGAPVGRDDVFFFFNKRSQSRRRRPSVVFGFETEREISMPFFTAFRQHSFLRNQRFVSFAAAQRGAFAVLLDEEEKEETKDEVPSLFNKQREVLQRGDFKGCQWNIKYAFVYNRHFVKAVLKIQKDSLGNGVDTILALIDDEKVEEKKKKKTHTKRLWEPSPSVVELYKTHLSSETSGAGGGGGGTSSSTNNNNNIVLDLGSGVGHRFYLSRIQRFHRVHLRF